MSKQALGKGLGALIKKNTTAPSEESTQNRVRDVMIDLVVPSPLQPRTTFGESPLDELVESIRQHGIIQPLIVRPVNGKLELIAGERRWRASKKLGLSTVPVIEREASDRDVLEMALIENLQREDLNPIEEASGYLRLVQEFNMKQEEIASRVGKSRASVANGMRLLDLQKEIQMMVAQKVITVGHAKAIVSIKDHSVQHLIADQVIKKGLTVRATERLAQSFQQKAISEKSSEQEVKKTAAESVHDVHIQALTTKMRSHFSTHVAIQYSPKRGKIEIEYYGIEDLNRLLDLLGIQGD